MNKKLFIVVILVLLIFILLSLLRFHKLAPSLGEQIPEEQILTEMQGGRVTKVTETDVFIEGSVGGADKEVEFSITPQTVINKVTVIIRQDQMNGQPFKPDTRIEKGSLADLILGQDIRLIKTQDNLLKVSKTIATEINYTYYEIQKR